AGLRLLGVRVPGLAGVQGLRRMRELDDSVPVIMVTANEDVGLAKETLQLGAFDYVARPFDFECLDRAVAAGLARAGTKSPADEDPWTPLALIVFRIARGMAPLGRSSTRARLESAALAAAIDGAGGRLA